MLCLLVPADQRLGVAAETPGERANRIVTDHLIEFAL